MVLLIIYLIGVLAAFLIYSALLLKEAKTKKDYVVAILAASGISLFSWLAILGLGE